MDELINTALIREGMNMGFLDLNRPQKPKDLVFYANYILGHPSVAKTDLGVYLVLSEDKMIVYSAFQKGFLVPHQVKIEEKYKLFDIPYEKISSVGGDGSHLVVTAIGHDKSGGKRHIPIEFTMFSAWTVPDKTKCIQIKSALDQAINKINEITI